MGKVQNSDSAVVVLLGGVDLQDPTNHSNGKSALVFKPQLNQWFNVQPLPEPRNYHAAVYYGGYIYVLGSAAVTVPPESAESSSQPKPSRYEAEKQKEV